MSVQLDTLTASVKTLADDIALLVAKPPVTVPEDLSAIQTQVDALDATVKAAVSA